MNAVLGVELTRKLEGLRADLCLHREAADSLLREIERVLGNGISCPLPIHPSSMPIPPEDAAKAPGDKKVAIITQVLKLLHRGPYKTAELLTVLAEKGLQVKGKRPIQTLYGILHKDMKSSNPRVKRSKGGFWHIA